MANHSNGNIKYRLCVVIPPIASIIANTPCAVVKDLAVDCVSIMKSLYIRPKEFT